MPTDAYSRNARIVARFLNRPWVIAVFSALMERFHARPFSATAAHTVNIPKRFDLN